MNDIKLLIERIINSILNLNNANLKHSIIILNVLLTHLIIHLQCNFLIKKYLRERNIENFFQIHFFLINTNKIDLLLKKHRMNV